MSAEPKHGDRVLAALNGSGWARKGTVCGTLRYSTSPDAKPKYFVLFDGDGGFTGPCVVLDVLDSMSP